MNTRLLISVFLAFLSLNSFALEVDPFLSAADREKIILEKESKEKDLLKEMVAEAIKSMQKLNGSSDLSEEERSTRDMILKKSNGSSNLSSQNENAKSSQNGEIENFAIAGIKGDFVLIRKMNNQSVFVKNGETFWSNGMPYKIGVSGSGRTVSIMNRKGKVVFQGGAGSVFSGGKEALNSSQSNAN